MFFLHSRTSSQLLGITDPILEPNIVKMYTSPQTENLKLSIRVARTCSHTHVSGD